MQYKVIGLYKRRKNDIEGISLNCESYAAAAAVRIEWKNSNNFKRIFIVKSE